MTFEEKLVIAGVGALLGALISIITNRLFKRMDRNELKSALYQELTLLCTNMKAAIVNEDVGDVRPTVEHLLSNYHVFCQTTSMKDEFNTMFGIYVFIKNDGYKSNPERKEQDLKKITEICGSKRQQRRSRGHPSALLKLRFDSKI